MKTLSFLLLGMSFGVMAQFYPPTLVTEDGAAYPSLENADIPAVEAPEMFRLHGFTDKKVILAKVDHPFGLSSVEAVEAAVVFDESAGIEEVIQLISNFRSFTSIRLVIDGRGRLEICRFGFHWGEPQRVVNCPDLGIDIVFLDSTLSALAQ